MESNSEGVSNTPEIPKGNRSKLNSKRERVRRSLVYAGSTPEQISEFNKFCDACESLYDVSKGLVRFVTNSDWRKFLSEEQARIESETIDALKSEYETWKSVNKTEARRYPRFEQWLTFVHPKLSKKGGKTQ